ncbi:MAG TPA: TolC family protein [Vicinamibacterales bacterium]|nr:TolC family protein [Vicinamibacterales bacterium]
MRFDQRLSGILPRTGALVPVIVLFASGLGVSASGQTPQEQPAAQVPAPATPAAAPLRIGQDEAVKMALENNLGIQTERLSPQIRALAVSQAYAVYRPVLFAGTSRNSNTAPPTNFLQTGGAATVTSGNFSSRAGLQQNLPWMGGSYTASLDGYRATSDEPLAVFSPQLGSTMNFQYDQPLLRDFRIDSLRQSVLQAQNQQDVADIQLAERVTQTSRAVRNAYLNLVAAMSGLQVAEQSLNLARQALRNNERRVEVGTMAPIDIVAAEAEVARNEENVIVQQGNIEATEDALRTLIMNPSQPDFWTTRLEPAEQPLLTQRALDVESAITNALTNRTDLAQLRKQIESTDISIKFNQNQKLPSLDFQARYGVTGVGGTRYQYGPEPEAGGPRPIIAQSQRSFGDVLRDVFGNDFRNWTVSLAISYPLGTSVADAALAASRLQRQQAQVSMRDLEVEIARQVREAGRQVSTTLKRVEATRKSRELAERSLEAEEKRLEVGLSDSFRLFQFQRDLATARQAELNAIIAYNRALINFEAIQSVPAGL